MSKRKSRIDLFEQLRVFYSLIYSGELELNTHQQSLYLFLLHQNNRNLWAEWFKCPFDLAMTGSSIGSRQTYYKCLHYLEGVKLIKYIPGINDYKAPRISIVPLLSKSEQQIVPLSEPVTSPLFDPVPEPLTGQESEPLCEQILIQLPEPLPEHIIKPLTIKLRNHIRENWENLKTGNSPSHSGNVFYVGKEKIYDLKNVLEEKFPARMNTLKKNYGENFCEIKLAEFSDNNIEKIWKDDQDLASHFTNYLKNESVKPKKNSKPQNTKKLSKDELKDKYKV